MIYVVYSTVKYKTLLNTFPAIAIKHFNTFTDRKCYLKLTFQNKGSGCFPVSLSTTLVCSLLCLPFHPDHYIDLSYRFGDYKVLNALFSYNGFLSFLPKLKIGLKIGLVVANDKMNKICYSIEKIF